ncbi:MAG: hypothetical protein WBA91_07965, partial [Paracoccaceae bacterium]
MLSQAQTIHLYAGGHPTDAEDLLVFLAANRSGLRRAGYGFFGFELQQTGRESLEGLMPRQTITDTDISTAAAAVAGRIAADRRGGSTGFVLAVPELLGPAGDLLEGRFFTDSRTRAKAIRLALGQRVDRLVLAVQPYEVLLQAAWATAAMDRKILPFGAFAATLSTMAGVWVEAGLALTEELGVGELIIQLSRTSPQQSLGALVPGISLRQPIQPLP